MATLRERVWRGFHKEKRRGNRGRQRNWSGDRELERGRMRGGISGEAMATDALRHR